MTEKEEISGLVPAARQALTNLRHDAASFEAALGDLWGRLESAHSRRAYRQDWRLYCDWLKAEDIDPRVADVADVQRYVNALREAGRSKSTRARALSVLREVYRALVIGKVCATNPAREVKNPKVGSTPKTPWLDEGGLRRFADALWADDSWRGRRDRTMILCLALLGSRRAEITRLRVEDFSGGTVALLVKRGKEEAVGVPVYLQGEIANWTAYAEIAKGPIFPRSKTDKRSLSSEMLYYAVKKIARKAKLDKVTPHAIRRSFITILEERGVPIRDLQLAVSHESVTTTERYQKAAKAARQAPGQMLVDLVRKKEAES